MFIDQESTNISPETIKQNIEKAKQEQVQYNRMSSNCAHFVLNVLGIEAKNRGQTPQLAGVIITTKLIANETDKNECINAIRQLWMDKDPIQLSKALKEEVANSTVVTKPGF